MALYLRQSIGGAVAVMDHSTVNFEECDFAENVAVVRTSCSQVDWNATARFGLRGRIWSLMSVVRDLQGSHRLRRGCTSPEEHRHHHKLDSP